MLDELADKLGEHVRLDEPMSLHTTFGIGGPADALVDVETPGELETVLHFARERGCAVHVVGRGANVLVSDDGIRGIVVRLRGEFRALEFDDKADTVQAGAGVPLGVLVDESGRRGFFGFCWAAGIPGTVGGALVSNAGSHGHAMGEFVEDVTVVNRDGGHVILPGNVVCFKYRRAVLPVEDAIVAGVTLRLGGVDSDEPDPERLRAKYLARKRATQPLDVPSAGSVFRNPEGVAAGALIDRAGCKGLRKGGAAVSEKHANFIVNDRGATAADVLGLIEMVRERVRAQSGVELELELRRL